MNFMPNISIEVDAADKARVERMLRETPRAISSVLRNAANRTATWLRREAATILMHELGTTSTRIRRQMEVLRATRSRPAATLRIKRDRIPLMNLAARQTQTGVVYTLGGQRRTIRHAFIATMRSGHRGVFLRAELRQKHPGKQRRPRQKFFNWADLPISELFGPSLVRQIRTTPGLLHWITELGQQRFAWEVNRGLQAELAKRATTSRRAG